jgi:hypothetical protein
MSLNCLSHFRGQVHVLALREESYYTANLQKTLTAYTSRKFHIASPHFRKMIVSRINFALDVLENGNGPIEYILKSGLNIDRKAVADFLRITEASMFEKNRNISRLIEALSFGNMRMALDMFRTFMTSGATDVDKMLTIYRQSGAYFVAFHEFVKSVMLGERQYYKDAASPILNVFDCGADRNSSHFTALRILRVLAQRRGESNREGQGYAEIARLVGMSEDTFNNREDAIRTLNRLLARQLIEANTRSVDSILGASHVRLTSAGWYYSRYLVRSFSYVDLVLQDTPFSDEQTERAIRDLVHDVDNLSDRPDQKMERMSVRFERVRAFLRYLQDEEEREVLQFDLNHANDVWRERFAAGIEEQIDREISWISKRIHETRERVIEDIHVATDDAESEFLGVDDANAEGEVDDAPGAAAN